MYAMINNNTILHFDMLGLCENCRMLSSAEVEYAKKREKYYNELVRNGPRFIATGEKDRMEEEMKILANSIDYWKGKDVLCRDDEERLTHYVEPSELYSVISTSFFITEELGYSIGKSGNNLPSIKIDEKRLYKRYIYSCKSKGWIDLKHVISSADMPLGEYYTGYFSGIFLEFGQLLKGLFMFDKGAMASAFNSEDFLSNAIGSSAAFDKSLYANRLLSYSIYAKILEYDVLSREDAIKELKCPGSVCKK